MIKSISGINGIMKERKYPDKNEIIWFIRFCNAVRDIAAAMSEASSVGIMMNLPSLFRPTEAFHHKW